MLVDIPNAGKCWDSGAEDDIGQVLTTLTGLVYMILSLDLNRRPEEAAGKTNRA